MIADRSNGRTVQSTMTGEKIAMGIDPTATAHIMNVLTDLYSDPEAAVIREYSTNAHDAHIEAGVDKPIEVSTPTTLSPFLRVRDYGCGLTVDDIHDIYSQYGASTKRGTNEQVGMLGLGCKSALTYADQFTLTSVKNGTKVVVVVGRDEEGAGTMTVIDTRTTNEPDGTEVMIPAKRHNSIATKAADFFTYWPEGSVLLDGKQPQRFEGLRLTDDLYIIESGESKVVMGNVAYPADIDLGVRNVNVLAFVPIGSVAFPPARESLMYTSKTKATLAQIAKDYHASVSGAIQREVDDCKTPAEAIRTIVKWSQYVPGAAKQTANYTYKGKTVPQSYEPQLADGKQMQELITVSRYSYYRSRSSVKVQSVPVSDWPYTLWIANFVPAKLTKQHKDKAYKWCAEKGINIEDVTKLVTDPSSGPVAVSEGFIDPSRVLDWTEVRKVQLQPVQRNGRPGRVPGSFDVYVNGEYKSGAPGDSIDLSKPVFWINANYWQARRYSELLQAHYPEFTLVCLPANRIAKFCRNVPQAKGWQDGLKAVADKWVTKLTKQQKRAIAMRDADSYGSGHDLLRRLDASRVEDPAIKEAVKLANVNVDSLMRQRSAFTRYHLDLSAIIKEKWTNPLNNYPLAQSYNGRVCDHLYLYLNAAYEASK